MTQNTKLHAALVIACGALALSIYAAVRGPRGVSEATATGPHACVDQQARDQSDKLRKALAERDALVARLARAASTPTSEPAKADAPPRSGPPPAPGPRRYTHFEVPNPAVTVTQKDDATYDIRTTDPKLSGTTMRITAVTQAGDEDTLYIRIP